jgi:hypothetical protein
VHLDEYIYDDLDTDLSSGYHPLYPSSLSPKYYLPNSPLNGVAVVIAI